MRIEYLITYRWYFHVSVWYFHKSKEKKCIKGIKNDVTYIYICLVKGRVKKGVFFISVLTPPPPPFPYKMKKTKFWHTSIKNVRKLFWFGDPTPTPPPDEKNTFFNPPLTHMHFCNLCLSVFQIKVHNMLFFFFLPN